MEDNKSQNTKPNVVVGVVGHGGVDKERLFKKIFRALDDKDNALIIGECLRDDLLTNCDGCIVTLTQEEAKDLFEDLQK